MTQKEQVEGLMNELLNFAEQRLNKHGEFHPFGGYLEPSGAMVHVGAQSSTESNGAQQEIDVLIESFKKLAVQRKAIAFGVVADVKLPKEDGSKGDAIKFFLEHQNGYCAEVFFSYEITGGDTKITDTIAQQGEPLFFTSVH